MDNHAYIRNGKSQYSKNECTAKDTLPFSKCSTATSSWNFYIWLKKITVGFIWNNGRPRIRLSLLYLPFDGGGLKCPNFKFYYWATQLRTIVFYFSSKNNPHWVEMESHDLKLSLPLFMYCDRAKNLRKQTRNPILKNMIKV